MKIFMTLISSVTLWNNMQQQTTSDAAGTLFINLLTQTLA